MPARHPADGSCRCPSWCCEQGNHLYPKAYRFFEQKRLLEKKPKSAGRLANEQLLGEHRAKWAKYAHLGSSFAAEFAGEGFGLRHDDGHRWGR